MLDLVIEKGERRRRSGLADIGMHVKSSAQGRLLCVSSWHPPFVHRSWPISRLLHFSRCVSGSRLFVEASIRLLEKLQISSPFHPGAEDLVHAIVTGTVQSSQRRLKQETSRIIVPWHPSFPRVSHALRHTGRLFSELGFPELSPGIVYSIGGTSLLRCVQAICKSKLAEYGSGR